MYVNVCVHVLRYKRNSCIVIGMNSSRELEVDAAPIAVQGVGSGTKVGVNSTAELHVTEQ